MPSFTMERSQGEHEGKEALIGIYVGMTFLDSHIDRAKQNVKEIESLMDTKGILKYYKDQLDYIGYSVKDISGKMMKCIHGGGL